MKLSESNILITGGAGLVGSHLAQSLLSQGATVHVADNLSKSDRDRIPSAAEFIEADLTSEADVAEILTSEILPLSLLKQTLPAKQMLRKYSQVKLMSYFILQHIQTQTTMTIGNSLKRTPR